MLCYEIPTMKRNWLILLPNELEVAYKIMDCNVGHLWIKTIRTKMSNDLPSGTK